MDLSHLTVLSIRYFAEKQDRKGELPGLAVLRREAQTEIESSIYKPVLCLVLQGSKIVSIGEQVVTLAAGDALLVSHDLPVVSRITRASDKEPYLAVVLSIDLRQLRSLYDEVSDAPVPDARVRSLCTGQAEQAWLTPLIRYFGFMDSPMDAKVLGPSTVREIHYRLLLSPIGKMLRHLLVADSHASRVARAIQRLREDYRSPLKVTELAKDAGMSASSFHEHFKAVTGTTPLQYQKDLRLIEARALLTERSHTISGAAFAVGYESPNHFSRDFRRKFGSPPGRSAYVPNRVAQRVI